MRSSFDMVLEPVLSKLPPRAVYLTTTVTFVVISCLIGIAIPNVTVILGYKGAVLGSLIVYIFPGAMLWAVSTRPRPRLQTEHSQLSEASNTHVSVVSLRSVRTVPSSSPGKSGGKLNASFDPDRSSLSDVALVLPFEEQCASEGIDAHAPLLSESTSVDRRSVASVSRRVSVRCVCGTARTPVGALCVCAIAWGLAMGTLGALSTAGVTL